MTDSLLIVDSADSPDSPVWRAWLAESVSAESGYGSSGKAYIESYPAVRYYALMSGGGTVVRTFGSEGEARLFAAASGLECEPGVRVMRSY